MDGNYMFLCGVMWCQFGQQEAAQELLRAANSGNPDMSALAWAMLKRGARRLRDLEKRVQTSARAQALGVGALYAEALGAEARSRGLPLVL
jgi:hypothetical protein